MNGNLSKSAKKYDFQSQLKSSESFRLLFFSIKNYRLGKQLFLESFLGNFYF